MKKVIFSLLVICLIGSYTTKAEALVVINEFLADPASQGLLGDANGDGISSSSQDEFIELLNISSQDVSLEGWTLRDRTKVRHTFNNTILPAYSYLVVFGGGDINLAPNIIALKASSGSLGLNNSGDQIILSDNAGIEINAVQYGKEAAHDQSLVRNPEGFGTEFVLHSALASNQGKRFSPGYGVFIPPATATVPEPSGLFLFCVGCLMAGMYKKSRRKYNAAK